MFLFILDCPQGPHTFFETCMADKHRRLYFVVLINNIYLTYYNTNGYRCWYISIDFNFENISLLITDFSNIKFDLLLL